MSSNIPIVRQVAWVSVIPQFLLMGLLIYSYYLLGFRQHLFWGALTYLILSFGLKFLIPKNHRQGMRLTKQHKFTEAIPYFEKSTDFFSRHSWVDKYRFLTLLSSSKVSYREMGLCNIAFCYSQTGNGQKAKEYYQQTLKEYPDNGMAVAGLNMLTSMDSQS